MSHLDWRPKGRENKCTRVDVLAGWLVEGASSPGGLKQTEVSVHTGGESADSEDGG